MTAFTWLLAPALLALAPGPDARRPPRFGTATEIVRLDVRAAHEEAALLDLTSDDFEVRDSGVPQRIRVSAVTSLPVDVVVLFDTSDSVAGPKLDAFRACGRTIAEALREGDRAAAVSFSDVLALRSALAPSAAPLRRVLDDLRAGGSTALFDAVFAALAVSRSGPARQLFILFTDGRDTVSWLSADDVVAAARRSEATIYAVSTASIGVVPVLPGQAPTWKSVAAGSDDAFLRRITRETGGRFLQADSVAKLQALLATVLREIATRYVITYEPVGATKAGWHPVQVRLKHHRGEVLVRPGYFRLAPGAHN